MTNPEQKLCDNCHERPATSNICHGNRVGEPRSLCHICLLQDQEVGGLMARFNEAVRQGHCKHCGAPAETAWGGSSSFLGDHFNLVCMPCFNDLTQFVRQPENALPHFEPGDKEAVQKRATQLTDYENRQNEFMKQRIAQRKSK